MTSSRRQFLESCRKANQGEISNAGLIETTAGLGFVNVIPASQVINLGDAPYGSSTTIPPPSASPGGLVILDEPRDTRKNSRRYPGRNGRASLLQQPNRQQD